MTAAWVLETQAHTPSHTQFTYTVWSPYNIKSCFIVNVENNNIETTWNYQWTYSFFLRSLRLSCCRKWYLRYMASFHISITWQRKRKVWFRFSPGGKWEVKNPTASFSHKYARTRSCRQRQTLSPIHFQMEWRKEGVKSKAHTCLCLKTLVV